MNPTLADLIGGISQFVKEGDRVLIKPNLLIGKAPERTFISPVTPVTLSATFLTLLRVSWSSITVGFKEFSVVFTSSVKALIAFLAGSVVFPQIGNQKPLLFHVQ
jgi:hypothetical protein